MSLGGSNSLFWWVKILTSITDPVGSLLLELEGQNCISGYRVASIGFFNSVSETKIAEFANSRDLDELAHFVCPLVFEYSI